MCPNGPKIRRKPPNVHNFLRARNDDLVERMNGKMKKTEDNVETVSSKICLIKL